MKKLFLIVSFLSFAVIINAQDPKGLNVNDSAPLFTAKDQNDRSVSLQSLLKKGPVVLVFYRGQWCPYCNKYLKKLEDSLFLVTEKGASLVAVTPEKPENISRTIEKTHASYPVLFDEGLKIMKAYDVAYEADEKMIDRYKKYGIDFTIANGTENGAHLPVPAVYVINPDGRIVFRHFDKDYTKRAPLSDILSHL